MKREKGAFLFLVIGAMELSWRYAWANFLTTSILSQLFPFPEAIVTFAMASVLTLFSKGKGWRIVYVLSIQVFGFILAALRIVYVFNSWPDSFLSQTWLIEFFNTPRGPLEWLCLILILFLALVFWVGGVTFAKRSTAYSALCARFDLDFRFQRRTRLAFHRIAAPGFHQRAVVEQSHILRASRSRGDVQFHLHTSR